MTNGSSHTSPRITVSGPHTEQHIMKMAVLGAVKVLLQLILLIVFGVLFGKPAIRQYLNKHVRLVTTQMATGGLEAPAITLAALGSSTRSHTF